MLQRNLSAFISAIVAAGLAACGGAYSGSVPSSAGAMPALTEPATPVEQPMTWHIGQKIYVANAEPVGNFIQNEILVFTANNGNTPPYRTILPAPMNSGGKYLGYVKLATDGKGSLYILFDGNIGVYGPPFVNGPQQPVRYISGSNTGMDVIAPNGMDVDADGTIYVSVNVEPGGFGPVSGHILVFAPGATGNVFPTRTIPLFDTSGTGAEIDGVEAGGTYLFTSESTAQTLDILPKNPNAPSPHCRITPPVFVEPEFKAPFGGPLWGTSNPNMVPTLYAYNLCNQTPVRTLGGSHTGFQDILGVAGDGNRFLYVLDSGNPNLPIGANPSVFIFNPNNQNGNKHPNITITGPATHLFAPYAITIDR